MKGFLVSVFFFSALLAYWLLRRFFGERLVIIERLKNAAFDRAASKRQEEDLLSKPFSERVIRPVLTQLSGATSRLLPVKSLEKLERALQYAGNPGNLSPQEFQAIQYFLAGALALVFLVVAVFGHQGMMTGVFLCLAGGGAGLLGTKYYLAKKAGFRQRSIRRGLPDLLDLLSVSIEAGLGFDAALFKVVEKSKGQLADELRKTLQEMQMGVSRRQALRGLGERTGVEELQAFVGAMIQADQLGVPVSKVIRIQAEQVRLKRRQLVEEKAMKAPVKMLFPLVFFIFPSIFIVLLGPAAMQLVKTLGGN